MYPIPLNETLVETKVCKHCGTSFPITDEDLEFYEKVSPVFNGKKYQIPTPLLCPDCRQQRRLSFRNERKLYKRKCDATNKDIVSIYSPDKPYKVYHQDFWWSDAWDPMSYGRDFDFGRGFFEQFAELYTATPRPNSDRDNCENCDYGNFLTNGKNCYLSFNGSNNEDCLYSNNITANKDVCDCSYVQNSTHCYNSVYLDKCTNVISSFNCENGYSLDYCINCNDCKNCILCSDLTNKEFHIRNIKYSPDEYKKIQSELYKNKNKLEKEFTSIKLNTVQKFITSRGSEKISGDIIYDSENIRYSFEIYGSENIAYSQRVLFSRNCMDVTIFGLNSDLGYELHNCGSNFYQNLFSSFCYPNNRFITYCINCHSSSHLFGCVGLHNKQYCILNKQYTREEYEIFVPRIIEHMQKTGEWGEFFPSSLSPFGYNETVAQEYFPLSRDSVIARNEAIQVSGLDSGSSPEGRNSNTFLHGPLFNWSDYEAPFPKVEKVIPAEKLPDDITKIPDDILNWAIECEVTQRPFRIIKQELDFYRKHNLPIPRRHPDQRHLDRMALRNPRKLFERKCDKCGKDMITTYAPCEVKPSLEVPLGCSPGGKEIVYCEECYNTEVIG